jgi:hypothetical protein
MDCKLTEITSCYFIERNIHQEIRIELTEFKLAAVKVMLIRLELIYTPVSEVTPAHGVYMFLRLIYDFHKLIYIRFFKKEIKVVFDCLANNKNIKYQFVDGDEHYLVLTR